MRAREGAVSSSRILVLPWMLCVGEWGDQGRSQFLAGEINAVLRHERSGWQCVVWAVDKSVGSPCVIEAGDRGVLNTSKVYLQPRLPLSAACNSGRHTAQKHLCSGTLFLCCWGRAFNGGRKWHRFFGFWVLGGRCTNDAWRVPTRVVQRCFR